MEESFASIHPARPWNKGKLLGQKAPLKVSEVWAIRVRLQLTDRARDLALLDLAIDSKLRSCDLVALRVRDIFHGDRVGSGTRSWRAPSGTWASRLTTRWNWQSRSRFRKLRRAVITVGDLSP